MNPSQLQSHSKQPGLMHTQVSVALCTCNGGTFLREQLQSIAAQTVLPTELVVCDDASTDNTIAILEEFARTAPFPVKLHQNPKRLGPAANFGKAIGLCQGEFIFLCDQDDSWKPFKIERTLRAFAEHPDAVYAFSDAEMMDQDGTAFPSTLWETVEVGSLRTSLSGSDQLTRLLHSNFVTGATMAFRASFRQQALPMIDYWMHDYWIALLASSVSYGVPIAEPLLRYRRHAWQVCGWKKKTFWQVCLDSLRTKPEDSAGKLEKFRALLARIESMSAKYPCPADRIRLLEQKERHLSVRSRSRNSFGPVRVARVLAEASTGRYRRFSESWYSILRDLWFKATLA